MDKIIDFSCVTVSTCPETCPKAYNMKTLSTILKLYNKQHFKNKIPRNALVFKTKRFYLNIYTCFSPLNINIPIYYAM